MSLVFDVTHQKARDRRRCFQEDDASKRKKRLVLVKAGTRVRDIEASTLGTQLFGVQSLIRVLDTLPP
jgi:hypothetical protein